MTEPIAAVNHARFTISRCFRRTEGTESESWKLLMSEDKVQSTRLTQH